MQTDLISGQSRLLKDVVYQPSVVTFLFNTFFVLLLFQNKIILLVCLFLVAIVVIIAVIALIQSQVRSS